MLQSIFKINLINSKDFTKDISNLPGEIGFICIQLLIKLSSGKRFFKIV
jgi:hypothetical protein